MRARMLAVALAFVATAAACGGAMGDYDSAPRKAAGSKAQVQSDAPARVADVAVPTGAQANTSD